MKLNEAITKIRVELQNKNLRKSGKNKFAGFEYFELADFLPTLNELMMENGVNDLFSIEDEMATLRLIKGDEFQTYRIPYTQFMTPTNKNGQPAMQDIQYLGALNTYYKRYLYLNAFGITDGEVVDAMDNRGIAQPKITKEQANEINTLIAKAMETSDGLDYDKFKAFMQCENVDDMLASNYEKVKKQLENKIAKG